MENGAAIPQYTNKIHDLSLSTLGTGISKNIGGITSLTHNYMTSHFAGLVPALQQKVAGLS